MVPNLPGSAVSRELRHLCGRSAVAVMFVLGQSWHAPTFKRCALFPNIGH